MRTSIVRRTALLVLVLALGLLLAACGADEVPVATGPTGGTAVPESTPPTTVPEPIPEGAAGLAVARERWDGVGIDRYTMTYRDICFCPQTTITVVVRDGDVVETRVDQDPDLGRPIDGLTVDDLFDEIQRAVDGDAAEIQATYDASTGRPTRYWIDQSQMMADEEHGVEVHELVAEDEAATTSPSTEPGRIEAADPSVVTTGTSQPRSVRQVAEASLTEPWGCGYGFHVTDPTRTVALQLWADAPPPAGPSTVTLPAAGWRGEVLLGHDLLSVGCADLDVVRPPAPDEVWTVVAGTLQITAPVSGGCGGGPAPATAIATGVAVVASDGSTITFPELALVNDQWGCAAG